MEPLYPQMVKSSEMEPEDVEGSLYMVELLQKKQYKVSPTALLECSILSYNTTVENTVRYNT